jgi:hypothetical protein
MRALGGGDGVAFEIAILTHCARTRHERSAGLLDGISAARSHRTAVPVPQTLEVVARETVTIR